MLGTECLFRFAPQSRHLNERTIWLIRARRRRMSFGKVPLGRGGSGVNFWKCRQPVFTHFVWDDGETVLRAVVKNLVILLPNEERSACNPFGGLRETYLRRVLGIFDRDQHAEIVIFPFSVLASDVENACSVNPVGALH